MTYISHFRFQPDTFKIQQSTHEEYQATRSHPDHSIKDRQYMERPPVTFTANRIKRASTTSTHAAGSSGLHPHTQHLALQAQQRFKMIGYNMGPNADIATTGTSQPNTLCLTDGMGPCIGVAIGGENLVDGTPKLGSKARIFHVFPNNMRSEMQIGAYIQKLQDFGLTVRGALHGGELFNSESMKQATAMRKVFKVLSVTVDFDEAYERWEEQKPLGVIIRNDHSVQFVTRMMYQP